MITKRKGHCPKCHQHIKLTRHHVYPKRHFSHFGHANEILWICWDCHAELEKLIPFRICQLWFYKEVVRQFLGTRKAETVVPMEDFDLAEAEAG